MKRARRWMGTAAMVATMIVAGSGTALARPTPPVPPVPDHASCVGWTVSDYATWLAGEPDMTWGRDAVPEFKAMVDGPFGHGVRFAARNRPIDHDQPCPFPPE